MRIILKLFVPVITGILVILGILKVGELADDFITSNYSFNPTDMGNVIFYYVLIPVSILPALLIQWFIIQPIIRKLDAKHIFWRLRLMHYILLITAIAASIVGYIFWRKTELWYDVVVAFIASFVLFFIYFIITVLLSKGIDQFDSLNQTDKKQENLNPDD